MEKVDYIIVGDGYAAMFFAHQLIKNNKSFRLFSEGNTAASHISAGVCNPVVLKRFVEISNAEKQLDYLDIVFKEIEDYTDTNYLIDEKVVRIFHDEKEKELWLKKSQKEELQPYLNTDFLTLNSVTNLYSSGIVNKSCRIDVKSFFSDMFNIIEEKGFLIKEKFDFDNLDLETEHYNNINFSHIVFAEGIAVNNNPYFDDIPVKGNKGHCLKVRLQSEVEPYVIKKKYFLFKFDEDSYYCGGTYERDEYDLEINQNSVDKLELGLKEIYQNDYNIKSVQTAFRAVVGDRKPILGVHKDYSKLYILNGLGARGVLNGSFYSKILFNFIENKDIIDQEVNVNRFY